MWDKYREEFPITDDYIYLNHAAVGPLSTRIKERIDSTVDLFMKKGGLCFDSVKEDIGGVREKAALMIGCSASEITFVKNTTSGVLLAAGGIHWKAGENVVMPGFEFPANVYPWIALKDRSVQVRMVQPENGKVTADDLIRECDEKTRAVTVSMVQFSNGYRIDLEPLGNFCRDNGILLHLDAIQGLGAIDIDVRSSGIDFLSAGGHKWLLSAGGAGIFYCREGLRDQMRIPNPGWTGVKDFMDFLDYRFEFIDSGSRFEEGSLNVIGIMALGASLERFLEIGMDRVQQRVLMLSGKLANALKEKGYTINTPLADRERSGIISFMHPEIGAEDIFGRLSENNIIASLREGAIRISPHFYNNTDDIDRTIDLLGG